MEQESKLGQLNEIPSYIEVITLCGSTKFKKEFEHINLLLTLMGKVVMTVSSFGHADKIEWTKDQKAVLDSVHKRKIDHSEAIFVVDVNGYIGSSTRSEIEHAENLGLPIYYLSMFPKLLNSEQGVQECDAREAKSTDEPMAQNPPSQEWKERFAMWYVKNHPAGLYEIIEWIETNLIQPK